MRDPRRAAQRCRASRCLRLSANAHGRALVRRARRRDSHETLYGAVGCRQTGPRDTLIEMTDDDHARAARATQRASTMRVRLMPQHPGREYDFSPSSGAEAVALACELSRTAWMLAGRALPSYQRENIPIRLSKRAPE